VAEKLEFLNQQLSDLNLKLIETKEEFNRLNLERKELIEKRNSLHDEIKEIRSDINDLKEKRDALNKEVQDLKGYREQMKIERKEKHLEILKMEEKIGVFKNKRKNMEEIEKELEGLEWKIQTTPFTLKEEKSIIDQVRHLETQLISYKKNQKLIRNRAKLQDETKEFRTMEETYHNSLSELAEQSQTFHEQMLKKVKDVQKLQAEADEVHNEFVEINQKANSLYQEQITLSLTIRDLKKELHTAQKDKREELLLTHTKELKDIALKKMKRGEKLTLEEFKILAKQGEL
jgi:uncharacterized coiled-coil DUF342 family protein